MSRVVLDSQRMTPQRLLEAGFQFDYPQLDRALRHLLS
jgi:NAD dependent epimerase/dehydratase family enzyme